MNKRRDSMSLDPSTLEAAQKQAKADGKRKDAERRASMAISIDSMSGMGGAAGGAGGGGRRRSVASVASSSTGPSKSNRRKRVSPAKAGGSKVWVAVVTTLSRVPLRSTHPITLRTLDHNPRRSYPTRLRTLKVSGGASVSSGRTGGSNASPYASTAKWEPSGGKQLATTSLYTASVLAYQPRSEPADARAFKRAGQGKNLRDGSFGDNTAVPALITFPKVLQSGKEQIIAKNKHDWPGGDLYGQLWSEGREKVRGEIILRTRRPRQPCQPNPPALPAPRAPASLTPPTRRTQPPPLSAVAGPREIVHCHEDHGRSEREADEQGHRPE